MIAPSVQRPPKTIIKFLDQNKMKLQLPLCFTSLGACTIKPFYGRTLRIFVKSKSVCPWQAFPAKSNVCG
jgi:hypothetical protein